MRHVGKVFALLLDFATLSEKSRREFLTMMNEFLVMSPLQKRRAINEWKSRLEDGSRDLSVDPTRR
ncbi:hypothetical protein WL40_32550 [Burkholderia ubonensis]|uniref:Uncharacterized protein n=2 Tax=Burkholderia cepacia complex TaxID=87882 RepID=A0A107BQQ8_9BURK|nr:MULTISPECIES: hypothetical protein [Burkholderia cepacia complex]AOJ64955.1 hypothetical protein WJ32_20645 [Burkholderia ubonensis]AOK20924.1 hypothetical protein WT26_21595 [Burkholderia cepacia]AOK25375.1 hypothetical protein WK67_21520 [Burkholderia ubonensis]KVG75634.1 hypothetical protein WJ33_13965 [Burkholderia ubonensis]KVH70665.1 hypothetical protein WJ41_16925 [Burkholderia ubonensis]